MKSNKQPAVTAVPIHALLNTQTESTYKMIAPIIWRKSPRENENKTMKVKQQTIAGPKSPNNRKRKIVARIAIKAKPKKDHRLFQVEYEEINFSLVAK